MRVRRHVRVLPLQHTRSILNVSYRLLYTACEKKIVWASGVRQNDHAQRILCNRMALCASLRECACSVSGSSLTCKRHARTGKLGTQRPRRRRLSRHASCSIAAGLGPFGAHYHPSNLNYRLCGVRVRGGGARLCRKVRVKATHFVREF